MKLLKHFLVSVILICTVSLSRADEGMWLPQLLAQLNERQMKGMGMKITAADIYNINKASLKDAIVSFGGFCTGEVISGKGLILTNHHCGFDAIQNHSTLERNYIRDGFWAANHAEEIPNAGLFVTFIVRIDDVSKQVLAGVSSSMSESERQSLIDKNIAEVRKNVKKETYQDNFVRAFFEGNRYYLFVTETYRDIRLVGAPPSSIGNFGKDTDNWMWPRHTGDFSLFRIYAGKDNKPAEYAKDNVPYTPRRSLSISLDGVSEGDFTMVFGFPGRTMQYLHSAAVDQIMTVNDPAKIAIREKALAVIDGFMRRDEKIKIQYAAKYAGIQNSYKKWQGEVLGLSSTNAVAKKQAYETEFQKRVNANPQWKNKYGTLLQDLGLLYTEFKPYGYTRDYFSEIVGRVELFTVASQLNALVAAWDKDGEKGYQQRLPQAKRAIENVFDEYNITVDQRLFEALMKLYLDDQEDAFVSPMLKNLAGSPADIVLAAQKVYTELTADPEKHIGGILSKSPADAVEQLRKITAVSLYNDLLKTYQSQAQGRLNDIQAKINRLQRLYMEGQMEVFKEKTFYPDANSTLRVTYGNVKGYNPRDAVTYDPYTWLDGIMEKYQPGDYEFDVPEKLRSLYASKDYGQYGSNGKMPVCFIARNHTTGGNSGSPALDAWGNLVGLNFDRVWEGTMSDINYDPSICRNIMVDIRYVLFIIEKYAGAEHLIKEMKLVRPKRKLPVK